MTMGNRPGARQAVWPYRPGRVTHLPLVGEIRKGRGCDANPQAGAPLGTRGSCGDRVRCGYRCLVSVGGERTVTRSRDLTGPGVPLAGSQPEGDDGAGDGSGSTTPRAQPHVIAPSPAAARFAAAA